MSYVNLYYPKLPETGVSATSYDALLSKQLYDALREIGIRLAAIEYATKIQPPAWKANTAGAADYVLYGVMDDPVYWMD